MSDELERRIYLLVREYLGLQYDKMELYRDIEDFLKKIKD